MDPTFLDITIYPPGNADVHLLLLSGTTIEVHFSYQIFSEARELANPKTAENLSTVLACVGAISSGLASLPAYVYRSIENGREIDDRHAVARLIAQGPNQHQTWADWIEWTMASVLLRGNAISEIVTDGRGAVMELRPIPFE